jgi:hypothetical protein
MGCLLMSARGRIACGGGRQHREMSEAWGRGLGYESAYTLDRN